MYINFISKVGLISALLTILAAPAVANENHDGENSWHHNESEGKRHGKSHRHGHRHDKDHNRHANKAEDENHGESENMPNMFESVNPHGYDATYSTAGSIDLNNPFFKSLGDNDRSCATCHAPEEGWAITPEGVQKRFDETDGLDPLFRLVDGANSPIENVATVDDRRNAYSMLLKKANIRVGMGIPDDAEFDLVEIDDPYGFASETELSLYRRPLPTTNLKFVNAVMWEGRETTHDENSADCIFGTSTCYAPVEIDLATQANNATLGHAEALQELTAEERQSIVEFETSLFTAQVYDFHAGNLRENEAKSGPEALEEVDYYFGINDTVDGDYYTRESFNPVAMTLFDAWKRHNPDYSHDDGSDTQKNARAAILRGQDLFNSAEIMISGVSGLNDELEVEELAGSCTTCHNIPNAGNHSVPFPVDIGVSDASRRTPDMPLYTLKNKTTGETVETTDPGRALVTGKWKDIARFKGPVLRAVASRAPYFHDGSASDLVEVVDFYDERFNIGLTDQEKADLVAFLASL